MDDQLRSRLQQLTSALEPPPDLRARVMRSARYRRLGTVLVSAAFSLAVVGGGVLAATRLVGDDGPRLDSVGRPVCSQQEMGEIATSISAPIEGGGVSHLGIWFEARVVGHKDDCQPTFYIELDDAPVLPPDGEGPDADEFRTSDTSAENPCISSDRVSGNFLFAGEHTIEVGIGCDPSSSGPHATQEQFLFDGDSHEELRCNVPSFRPTYLPWGQNGEGFPPASVNEHGYVSTATWIGPAAGDVVSLSVLLFDGYESQVAAPRLPSGVEGFLLEHDALDTSEEKSSLRDARGTPAEWSINWPSKSTARCQSTQLAVQAEGLSKDEQRTELLKVAESLIKYP